jgi:hypothetical protein
MSVTATTVIKRAADAASAARHIAHGARTQLYPVIGAVDLDAMAAITGPPGTPDYERLWASAFEVVVGARRSQRDDRNLCRETRSGACTWRASGRPSSTAVCAKPPGLPPPESRILTVEFRSPEGLDWKAIGGGATVAEAISFARESCPGDTTWNAVSLNDLYGD